MAHIPNEDLERIERKLESIEQKIGNKWILPIIVAVISGLIGLATVVIQIRLERLSSDERMALEKKYKEDAEAWSQNKSFHREAIESVDKINGLFKRACIEPDFKDGNDLNNLCIACFTLINTHRAHYGEDEDFIKKMQEYDDLVQTSLFDFGLGKNTEQDRKKALDDSKLKYDEVLSSLDKFYKQYVTKPKPNGH